MTAELSPSVAVRDAARGERAAAADALRALAVAAGLCWAVLFVVLGLRYELQLYADGSIFSYSVAVEDGWAFHWHNITGRLFVYLFCHVPAELYVALTRDAHGGIAVYGFLFFAAPLLGLAATFAAERSRDRVIFPFACGSTACLCPLVFGFPTETWIAHAVFWPTLALCHHARPGLRGGLAVLVSMLALIFAYRGALIFAVFILATLRLRGATDFAFLRAARAFIFIAVIWMIVKTTFPPDPYIADVLTRAARHVFDLRLLAGKLTFLMLAALTGYGVAYGALYRLRPDRAHFYGAALIAAVLIVYWQSFDHALHTECRYYLRTIILVATPLFGALAMLSALRADLAFNLEIPLLRRLMTALSSRATTQAAIGALLLITLVNAVETAKFIAAWTNYKAAVRALAMGTASDPALGDARFVASQRIGADLNRLAWSSTTPYLSVLLAPDFAPTRLVVDPTANYFWLSCATAAANEAADRAVPLASRELVRRHACLHR